MRITKKVWDMLPENDKRRSNRGRKAVKVKRPDGTHKWVRVNISN